MFDLNNLAAFCNGLLFSVYYFSGSIGALIPTENAGLSVKLNLPSIIN